MTRDVSHLKDKKVVKRVAPLPLPTDLNNLRSIMQNSNSKGIQIAVSPTGISHLTCTHKECIERVGSHNSARQGKRKLSSLSPVTEFLPKTDRETLGSPTGMQEIERLNEWFSTMKDNCLDEESTKVIYTMCARELLRQVSVQSNLRGKLLEEIIDMQPHVYGKLIDKANRKFSKFQEEKEKEIQDLNKKLKEETLKWTDEKLNLNEQIGKMREDKKEIDEKLDFYKKNYAVLQRKYLEVDDMWKERIVRFMEDVQKNRRGSEIKIPMIEKLKLKQEILKDKNEEFKLVMENLSLITEQSLNSEVEFNRFKDYLIFNDKEIMKIEEREEQKKTFLDESVQVSGLFGVEIKESSEPIHQNTEHLVISTAEDPEKPAQLPNSLTSPLSPDINTVIPNLEDLKIQEIKHPLNTKEDFTNTEIPLIVVENNSNSVMMFEDLQKTQNKEALSLPENSQIPFQGSFFNESKRLTSLCTEQSVQTEDLLFLRYLENLKNIEDLLSVAKPEEIQQIHLSLQNLLQADQSVSSSYKKIKSKLSKPGAEKLAVLIEPLKKVLPNNSENLAKDIKQQVNELVNSTYYLNSVIYQKQQDLFNIERKIQRKSAILLVLSQKKTDKLINTDRRLSDPLNAPKSARIQKKMTDFEKEALPWDQGYEVGYSDGKIQGFLKALEKVQENSLDDELEAEEIEESKPSKKKNLKNKLVTKFMEFNFHVPLKQKLKKIHPGPVILERFLNRPMEEIKLRMTLSRRNINKILSVLYSTAVNRITPDSSYSLIKVSYDEFYARYGLKSVCNKKFLEFVASIVSNCEYKRCLMFMRLIRYGEVVSSYSYSKYSLLLYLSCFQFINTSKLGIYFSSDEDDKIMVPYVRVTECAKEKLDQIADRVLLNNILNKLDQKTVTDPRKINGNGLIELELALEIILDVYEKHISEIWKGVSLCLKALGQQRKHTVLGVDFYLISRLLGKRFKDLSQEVNVESMYMMCVKQNIGNETEVINSACSYSKIELLNRVSKYKEKILTAVESLKGQEEKFLTYEYSVWKARLEVTENYLDSDLFLANLGWKMYENEISRLTEDTSFFE